MSLARDALLHAGLLACTAAAGAAAAAAALAHGVLGLVEEGRHVCGLVWFGLVWLLLLFVVVVVGLGWCLKEVGCEKWGEGGMRARRVLYAFQTYLGPSSL